MSESQKQGLVQPSEGNTRGGIAKGMIINIILFLGLIALYAIHFTSTADDEEVAIGAVERKIDDAFNAIAFVDNGLLMEDYMFAIELRSDFEAEQRRLENDLDRRQRNFQMAVERFQRDIQAGTIGMEEAQLKEQELMQQQQDLMQLNETYRDRLARKELEMNTELLDKISDFLERYNEEKGYDFILGYAQGGGILYARETHDITREVLRLLNAEYDAQ